MFLVTISTEDSEEYKFAFYQKPSETKIKSYFYKKYGKIYKRKEWKETISYEIEELDMKT